MMAANIENGIGDGVGFCGIQVIYFNDLNDEHFKYSNKNKAGEC